MGGKWVIKGALKGKRGGSDLFGKQMGFYPKLKPYNFAFPGMGEELGFFLGVWNPAPLNFGWGVLATEIFLKTFYGPEKGGFF